MGALIPAVAPPASSKRVEKSRRRCDALQRVLLAALYPRKHHLRPRVQTPFLSLSAPSSRTPRRGARTARRIPRGRICPMPTTCCSSSCAIRKLATSRNSGFMFSCFTICDAHNEHVRARARARSGCATCHALEQHAHRGLEHALPGAANTGQDAPNIPSECTHTARKHAPTWAMRDWSAAAAARKPSPSVASHACTPSAPRRTPWGCLRHARSWARPDCGEVACPLRKVLHTERRCSACRGAKTGSDASMRRTSECTAAQRQQAKGRAARQGVSPSGRRREEGVRRPAQQHRQRKHHEPESARHRRPCSALVSSWPPQQSHDTDDHQRKHPTKTQSEPLEAGVGGWGALGRGWRAGAGAGPRTVRASGRACTPRGANPQRARWGHAASGSRNGRAAALERWAAGRESQCSEERAGRLRGGFMRGGRGGRT